MTPRCAAMDGNSLRHMHFAWISPDFVALNPARWRPSGCSLESSWQRGGEGDGLSAVDEYPVGLASGKGVPEADHLFDHAQFRVAVDGPRKWSAAP